MLTAVILALLMAAPEAAYAQGRRRPATRQPKPVPVQPRNEPAKVACPESLGTGVRTGAGIAS